MMKLSIIIPTFQRQAVLEKTLSALQAQKAMDFHWDVFVVNDGSFDGTIYFLEKLARTWDKLHVFSQDNKGQGAARNTALDAISGADILMFLGDDIIPENDDFLQKHMDFHRENPEIHRLALGSSPWSPHVELNEWMKYLMRSGDQFGQERHLLLRALSSKKSRGGFDFWFFYTSNISMKASLVGQERFHEAFKGWGWEDIEFGYRLQKKLGRNLELVYIKEALAFHEHVMYENEAEKRRISSQKNARIFEELHPEIQILPRGLKRWIFSIIAHPLSPWRIGIFGNFWRLYAEQKQR